MLDSLTTRDACLYVDGSSFIHDGTRLAGVWGRGEAVVLGQKVIWAQALPRDTSALAQALRWAEGPKVIIYPDNWYAFSTLMFMNIYM